MKERNIGEDGKDRKGSKKIGREARSVEILVKTNGKKSGMKGNRKESKKESKKKSRGGEMRRYKKEEGKK